jgi:oligoendopeptidase F
VTDVTGAEGVRWNLTPLAPSEQAMKERLDAAVVDAAAFVERRPVDAIAAIEAPALAEALRELAALRAARREGEQWALVLQWSDGENPDVADISAWVDERLPRLDEAIRHFELAWMAIPDDRAGVLAGDERVAAERHYLLSVRRFAPFMLTPGEERVLSAREASASSAWKSLRDRTLGSLVTRFDDGTGEREWTLSELEAARRSNPDRELRRKATAATRELVQPALPVLAQCYDAVVADRLSVDRLRGHDDPMAARNLENEIDGQVVEQLLAAAEAHRATGWRWFTTKARLLGLERLDTIDLSAAAIEAPQLPWDEGRRLTVEVFESLSPRLGAEAERFFTEQRVDAEMRRGKPYGAFCIWPSTRVPGFALVNWSGQLGDLVALVHELGHGTHYALATAAQSDNSFEPGLAVAEIPSTFAELWLVDHLLEVDPELGRAVLARELDQMVLVAFMATALARYEQAAYAARAEGQALTPERLEELCEAELAKVDADAVSDEEGLRPKLWALMPHFVHERFYMYAYVFALLVAAGLVGRAREPGFADRYEEFLARGGSGSPDELLAILGVDLAGPEIWNDGFAVIDRWLDAVDQAT